MSPEEVTREVRRLEITTRHLVRDIMAGEYSSAFRCAASSGLSRAMK